MSEGKWKQADANIRITISPNDKDVLKKPGMAETYARLSRKMTREANKQSPTFPDDVSLQLSHLISKSVECTDPEEEKAIDAEIQSLIDKHQNQ